MGSIFWLSGLMIPIVFIIFAVVIASKKGEKDVFKQLYIYLVLFATLMMTIGGGISIFINAAEYISPDGYYQTFEDYKMMHEHGKGEEGHVEKTEEELKKSYDAMIEEQKENSKTRALNGMIKSLGFIVIPFPIFLYFNSLRTKREKEEE